MATPAEEWRAKAEELEADLLAKYDSLNWLGRWWLRRTDPEIEGYVMLARVRKAARES